MRAFLFDLLITALGCALLTACCLALFAVFVWMPNVLFAFCAPALGACVFLSITGEW